MRVLLAIPPLIDVNTPYPSTAYLTGFLRTQGYDVRQADFSVELINRLMSADGLGQLLTAILRDKSNFRKLSASTEFFLSDYDFIANRMEAVLQCIRGDNSPFELLANPETFFPLGPAGRATLADEGICKGYSSLSQRDKVRFAASLVISEIFAVIAEVDPDFGVIQYAQRLTVTQPSFSLIASGLRKRSFIDSIVESLVTEALEQHQPDLVGLTVPFPGNLMFALKIGRHIRQMNPDVKVVMGGGFCNTDLRNLSEPDIFDYIDYICLDDGERPLLSLLEHLSGRRPVEKLTRTFTRQDGRVCYHDDKSEHDIPQARTGCPTYEGLPLDKYIPQIFGSTLLNRFSSIYGGFRWNKLTMAHGCYWRKCSFCDVHLDYISRYDYAGADIILNRMEQLIKETGFNGFHFVDEACPPTALAQISKKIIERNISAVWFGNIRFDSAFRQNLTDSMARAGCIAVSGGIEVASDRILKLMEKGTSVAQIARVTSNFARSGIFVHGYLMYGFPTQTTQEIVDSLEIVRQLFENGCINSAVWHRFVATTHSPIGKDPAKYGISLDQIPATDRVFSSYVVPHHDPTTTDLDMLGEGLTQALNYYLAGQGLSRPVHTWFTGEVSPTDIEPDYIAGLIAKTTLPEPPDLQGANHDRRSSGNQESVKLPERTAAT